MNCYIAALSLVLAAGASYPAITQTAVESRPPNASDQTPQSPDQTRAPLPAKLTKPTVATIAEGLPQLWSLEFLPDGGMLVTAKEGRILIVTADGVAGADIKGVPEVASGGQGGLLDVALAPDFETTNEIYFSFSEPREGGNGTSVARARTRTRRQWWAPRQLNRHLPANSDLQRRQSLWVPIGVRSKRRTVRHRRRAV